MRREWKLMTRERGVGLGNRMWGSTRRTASAAKEKRQKLAAAKEERQKLPVLSQQGRLPKASGGRGGGR
eukprot:1334073-Rhodomonas_salina.1